MFASFTQRVSTVPLAARLVGLGVGVVVMRWLWHTNRIDHGPILCPFRLLTSHSCPMCGSTRAVAALSAGDISSAARLNPFGMSLAIMGGLWWIAPKSAMAFSQRLQAHNSQSARWVMVVIVVVSFTLSWLWNVSRW